MANHAVRVSVETVLENQVQEIALDGTELYVQPLSMSENLTKLAHKIDFYKDESAEKGKATSEGEKENEEEKALAKFQPSLWPWDSVRNKIKASLSEVSVLLDVLAIARQEKYMVLDPVSQEPTDTKVGALLMAKKKGLSSAASILISGAERLKKSHYELSVGRTTPDFHIELLRLRQNWRLKKVGNTILGDLSYRSAGSRFLQGGTFEVKKSDSSSSSAADPTTPGAPPRGALQVVIPSELEGVAYIQVAIKRVEEASDVASAILTIAANLETSVPSEAYWQQKLEAAQNVIFCKELFAHLAREAVQLKSQISHVVIGKQIISNLFPGVQLSIALCHYTGKDKKTPPMPHRPEHNHVLEHSLHQLLREVHYKNIHHSSPHPVTTTLGVNKRRRMAGPHAFSRDDLIEMSQCETLLEQIIKQAKHTVLRQKTMQFLDEFSRITADPLIASHWNSLSSALESTVKINITSQGYDTVRTTQALIVGTDNIKAVCRDGRVITLSFEEQELRDFILCQIAQHQISAVQTLSKMMGWQVLSINTHAGVGDMEPLGNTSTVMLASPTGERVLSIRSAPVSGIQVSVQSCPKQADETNSNHTLVKDNKWTSLGSPFKSINVNRIEGKNLVSKIELLMAALAK
ncbi:mediator of RNA polymerase II transcription subunit 17-like isoform X2 [Lineus longissimus]|uniref:mediator of RNA polymerase II transcription subunit 17-like isoform X2 n=1 Tax=Lineus longissimus TaxID=88925 RepID=UPI002B4D5DE9